MRRRAHSGPLLLTASELHLHIVQCASKAVEAAVKSMQAAGPHLSAGSHQEGISAAGGAAHSEAAMVIQNLSPLSMLVGQVNPVTSAGLLLETGPQKAFSYHDVLHPDVLYFKIVLAQKELVQA